MVLGRPSTKIAKNKFDPMKKIAARRQDHFFLCILRENFKNHLVDIGIWYLGFTQPRLFIRINETG